ncbi:MAG: LytTR family DNA-binding domain-containing protein [Lysobacter sp.]
MSPVATTASRSYSPDIYLAHRRPFEIGYWVISCCLSALGGSYAKWVDYQRLGLPLDWWQPLTWSWSSALLSLALVPALLWFTRRWPLHLDTWRQNLPWYLLASVVWSLLHVVGMVALRKLVYATQGATYDFGNWPAELLYEYSKDVRTFIGMVLLIHGYRLLVLRLQGEASLLDLPDNGRPVEPVERPERFLVRKLGREFLIAAEDVEWLQASGNYVNLHLDGRDYPLRSTIAGIESKLDPARFVRIHRSYIVNFDRIASIEPFDSGDSRIHLKNGSTLPCSRRYRQAMKERIGQGETV